MKASTEPLEGDLHAGRVIGGLVLGSAGAALIVLYTRVNAASRRRGAGEHWRIGWGLAGAGMGSMAAGWTLLAASGPYVAVRALSIVGAVLCGAALLLYLVSARWVGRWRSPAKYTLGLQTEGLYGHVRHPQALSLCVLSVGVGLLTGSLPYLITVPIWIAFWTAYTYLEESNELLPAFGDEYLRYRETTPRLIPRCSPRRRQGASSSRADRG